MKITALLENRVSNAAHNLKAEWGLSLFILFNGRHILFDTGATDLFAKNAEQLSINLASVDAAVLSHHHFDLQEVSGVSLRSIQPHPYILAKLQE